jgi:hypothetical protein
LDLSLSPDLEAYWCYLILFTIALIVASIQVRDLLKDFTNGWATARAWILLAAYTAVPIALFWLLDRSDAIHDTSPFAAILVAGAYRQILSGGSEGINVPGGFAKAWQPFVTWSDSVASGIRDRIARNTKQYDSRVMQRIATRPEVQDQIRRLLLNASANPAEFQSRLDEIEKLKPPLDDAGVTARKVALLYFSLKSTPDMDADLLLREEGVISQADYYLYALEWKSKLFLIAIAVGVVWGLAAWYRSDKLLSPENRARYDIWRFQKANATAQDRFRARERLVAGLHSTDRRYAQAVNAGMTRLLRFEALPLDTADRMLKLLFENPGSGSESKSLIGLLAGSLRTENPDLRARTQRALLYLSAQRRLPVPTELRDWTPNKEDAPTCVDAVAITWARLAEKGTVSDPASLACLATPGLTTPPVPPAKKLIKPN